MTVAIHPAGSSGVIETKERITLPDQGTTEASLFDGPVGLIAAAESTLLSRIASGGVANIASVSVSEREGRASMRVQYETTARSGLIDQITDENGTQELYGVDQVRDIMAAPYFASLTNNQVTAVVEAWEQKTGVDAGWSTLQTRLYGHIARGHSYVETSYELRITRMTASSAAVKTAASNPNTVQPLPTLSATLKRLIDSLPSGEWLKKPVQVQSAGRRGWTVTSTYLWAPKWSIIYGGTFTGET